MPFFTRVTISGLLVVAPILTGAAVLSTVRGGANEETVQGIIFYVLFMIPTLASVILAS